MAINFVIFAAAASLMGVPPAPPYSAIVSQPLWWECAGAYPVTSERPQVLEKETLPSPKEAQAELKTLKNASIPASLLRRAALKQHLNDDDGALKDYHAVLNSSDRSPIRSQALSGYKKILLKKIKAGEAELYGDLIQSLKDEWRNAEGLKALQEAYAHPKLPPKTKMALQKLEPIMALRIGEYERAAKLWAGAKNRSEIQWLAQAELRQGNFEKAAKLRLNLALSLPQGAVRNQELKAAFRILTQAGRFNEAKNLAEQYPAIKNDGENYHWQLGLAALMANEPIKAATFFEELTKPAYKGHRLAGAQYFLARSWELSNQAQEAQNLYKKIASGPFDYYQILAQGRLANPAQSVYAEEALTRLLNPGPFGNDHTSLGFYLWVAEKGLSEDALKQSADALAETEAPLPAATTVGQKKAAAFNAKAKTLLAAHDWPNLLAEIQKNESLVSETINGLGTDERKKWLSLAGAVAAHGGDYRLAVRFFSKLKSETGPGLKKWSHPLVYAQPVLEARRRHGLPPQLLLALIRTESAYQPDIISVSNAQGLMQLLPATANRIAAILEENEPGPLDLFTPEINIRYGSWYLKALIDSFGQVPLALAGYNGGPYNIKSLIEAKNGIATDLFVETLPFGETSNYVKRILESCYIYEMAYLGQASLPDLTKPVKPPSPDLPPF